MGLVHGVLLWIVYAKVCRLLCAQIRISLRNGTLQTEPFVCCDDTKEQSLPGASCVLRTVEGGGNLCVHACYIYASVYKTLQWTNRWMPVVKIGTAALCCNTCHKYIVHKLFLFSPVSSHVHKHNCMFFTYLLWVGPGCEYIHSLLSWSI